ncbi:MAG: peptide chain release factor 1 [Bacillota bacterium]
MFEKLDVVVKRFYEVEKMIADPDVISDREKYQKLTKEHFDLSDLVAKYLELRELEKQLEETKEMLEIETDSEMKEMLEIEIGEISEKIPVCQEELKVLMLPKDPDDDKNVIIEVRSGAGGDEAALFGGSLVRMYKMFADSQRWKIEPIEENLTELGGVKEVSFLLKGTGAFAKLKYESGVHRVQRVPATESQGRIHTSTVTVAVLPEAEEVEVDIVERDLKIDTYRSGGAGGQHVNTTDSAIRITHLPTGLVVTCEDERSQVKNKDKAMKVLKTRLYAHFREISSREYSDARKSQIGSGDRSERIRTYNYPQGRITDHRIGFTVYSLDAFLNGDLGGLIEALSIADKNAKLLLQSEGE